ncbi:MAG TPA: AraC family transcriptional regulator [Rhizomicrobium sp.]|jgi:AraC-like DNA-binding protein
MTGEGGIVQFDIALRTGAGVLLLLVSGLLARDYGRAWAAKLGAAFALGAAAFAASSIAGFTPDGSLWHIALLAISSGNNVVFWLFARALFDDDFKPRPWHALVWGGFIAATLLCGLVLQPLHSAIARPLEDGLSLASLGFAILAIVQTISSWSTDLVEKRRRFRVAVVSASAGYIVLTEIANLLGLRATAPEALSLASAGALALIAAGVAWSFLGVAGGEALFPEQQSAAPPPMDISPADRRLLADIERGMRTDRLYRQERLTIGALALKHAVPEYRLRRLINKGLGHRNFSSFLNSYRIADARAALADPRQAEVPILTIALDAGFNSLGPFNRAFRLETGTTPSAFRKTALGNPANEQQIPVSAG